MLLVRRTAAAAQPLRRALARRHFSAVGSAAGNDGGIGISPSDAGWVLDHGAGDFESERFRRIPSPKAIYNSLGEYMIGQHDARLALAVAVHNHYKRVAIREARAEQEACDLIEAASRSAEEDIMRARGTNPKAGNPHVAGGGAGGATPPSGVAPPAPDGGSSGPNAKVVTPDPNQTPQEQAQSFLERSMDFPPYPPNPGPPVTTLKATGPPPRAPGSDPYGAGAEGPPDDEAAVGRGAGEGRPSGAFGGPTASAGGESRAAEALEFRSGKEFGLAQAPSVKLGSGNVVEGCEVEKSNILLLGPTGSGKTLAAKTLARICQVPLVICDATTLTQAGYVGDDVETIVYKLYAEAGYDADLAARGIVYLDEVDKIARRSPGIGGYGRDVGGEGVQQALLKLLEGTVVNVPKEGPKKAQKGDTVPMDTSEILFIGAGAFSGLEGIVEHRVARSSIGFGAQLRRRSEESLNKAGFADPKAPPVLHQVEPQDLGDFGLLPEFIGRFPVVTSTEALDEDALVQVLTKPRNALCKQYHSMFSFSDCELHFTGGALRELARQARARGTGARGLRSIMEKLLQTAMFEVPGSDVTGVYVDAEAVKTSAGGTPPVEYVDEVTGAADAAGADGEGPVRLLRGKKVADFIAEKLADGTVCEEELAADIAEPLVAASG